MADAAPQRPAFCHVDEAGKRTITVLDEKLRPSGVDSRLPWHELEDADAVYFVSGDQDALRAARAARLLVATARELRTLQGAAVRLDALVGSGEDQGELFRPGDLEPAPGLVVTTSGRLGGWAQPGGPFRPASVTGSVSDAYGCGDVFAAGLTFGLARGDGVDEALALAARGRLDRPPPAEDRSGDRQCARDGRAEGDGPKPGRCRVGAQAAADPCTSLLGRRGPRDRGVPGSGEGAEAGGLPVRRPDDRLLHDGGLRSRERPPGGLLGQAGRGGCASERVPPARGRLSHVPAGRGLLGRVGACPRHGPKGGARSGHVGNGGLMWGEVVT